jgi:hypothetical protein
MRFAIRSCKFNGGKVEPPWSPSSPFQVSPLQKHSLCEETNVGFDPTFCRTSDEKASFIPAQGNAGSAEIAGNAGSESPIY